MISILAGEAKILELRKLLDGNAKKLKREIAIAVNKTSKKTQSAIAKDIGKEIATAQKNIKKTIGIRKKATKTDPVAVVVQSKTRRLSLREFGARQTGKGVSYKVSKTAGRKVIPGAFQGPRPGVIKTSWRGHAFKRAGKTRLPIIKLMGPSPWGVFVKKKLKKPVQIDAKEELRKQIIERIRFLKVKKSGAI